MLSLIDTWIKAAVEHRILNIEYFSARTKGERTNRDIEPDFVGSSRRGDSGLWATFCYLRKAGPRCFKPDSIKKCSVTEKTFTPPLHGRWKELISVYEEKGLKEKEF